jgi:two-component system, OmpR family, sensor kinase
MRRRLVLAIAGAVAAAVSVVGLGTLLLTQLDARHRNESELARRVTELAAVVAEVRPDRVRPVAERLQPALDVDAVALFALNAAPSWVGSEDRDRLRQGETVSTRRGDTTYTAAPILRADAQPAVRALMAIDTAGADFGGAGRWFVIAGAVTVLLGALVALRVARSLAGPLDAAETAARKIASGDLTARVPDLGDGNDELARLVRSINEMAESLQRSRETERDFLLSVSHDLRTPLTSIGGWAEALADRTAPDPTAAGHTILVEAGRLDRLVRDLLDLARLRARAFTLTRRPVDLRDIASGTGEGLRPDLEEAGLSLVVDVPADPVMVDGDPDRLAQITGNLLDNAGRHASTSVRMSVLRDGDSAVLAVDDDGPGIPLEDRPMVFERLHANIRPTARPGTGTGLGLAIVRELARAMGGDVVVAAAGTGGASLVVRLPVLDPSSTAVSRASSEERADDSRP